MKNKMMKKKKMKKKKKIKTMKMMKKKKKKKKQKKKKNNNEKKTKRSCNPHKINRMLPGCYRDAVGTGMLPDAPCIEYIRCRDIVGCALHRIRRKTTFL